MSITMIKPRPISAQNIRRAIDAGLKAALVQARSSFKLTYWNWEQQPEWEVIGPRTKSGDREIIYKTSSTPYVWVDHGTEGPYPIVARNAPTLKFQTGFIPMTQPGRMTSQVGARFGPWASPLAVEHPGIEPRRFSEQVAKEMEEAVPRHIDHYLRGV